MRNVFLTFQYRSNYRFVMYFQENICSTHPIEFNLSVSLMLWRVAVLLKGTPHTCVHSILYCITRRDIRNPFRFRRVYFSAIFRTDFIFLTEHFA